MKRLTAALVLLVFIPAQLSAWGPKGHAIVADIATSHLTPAAKQNLQLLLGNDSLASIANWADDVKRERDESYDWHFVDIPKDAAGFSQERDCFRPQDKHKNALTDRHNCVVDRIEMFQKVLGDANASRAERLEALKWIVHFVGDLHQPLHAIDEARGGNDIKVIAFGADQCGNYPCNLHWTWDQLLLEHTGYSEEDYVRHLEKLIVDKNLAARAGGTPEQWANESHGQARQILEQKPATIDDQYYQSNIGLVDEKLALAGLRLAALLNQTLGDAHLHGSVIRNIPSAPVIPTAAPREFIPVADLRARSGGIPTDCPLPYGYREFSPDCRSHKPRTESILQRRGLGMGPWPGLQIAVEAKMTGTIQRENSLTQHGRRRGFGVSPLRANDFFRGQLARGASVEMTARRNFYYPNVC